MVMILLVSIPIPRDRRGEKKRQIYELIRDSDPYVGDGYV